MATEKQVAANRQNAKFSTGPRTENGKRRSRRNALRHGLTAETVIEVLEDRRTYQALQRKIYADYRPRTNFELELVARLVSLLWRLRRAAAIESGLMAIQARATRKHATNRHPHSDKLKVFYELAPSLVPNAPHSDQARAVDQGGAPQGIANETDKYGIAESFIKAARSDSSIFERLGRYETRLWRQLVQTVLLLNSISRDDYDKVAAKRRNALWPPFIIEET